MIGSKRRTKDASAVCFCCRPPYWCAEDQLAPLSERELSPGDIERGRPAFVPGERLIGRRVTAIRMIPKRQTAVKAVTP